MKQPWAGMIAAGQKIIEARTWATNYGDPLLVASSRPPKTEQSGHALAIVDVVDSCTDDACG